MWKEEATSESIDNGRMNSAEKIVLSNPINVLKAIVNTELVLPDRVIMRY